MSGQKVKIRDLISRLVSEVDTIEASDMPQGEKTRKYKAAASKYKNALFMDKRKYRGEGLKNRPKLNTYNAYLSRARKRFDDRTHHAFPSNIERLSRKYPIYAEEITSWLDLPTSDVRQRMSQLQEKLKNIMSLAEKLSDIKLGKKISEKKIVRLANAYPAWKFALFDLISDNWKDAEKRIHTEFQQGISLLEELVTLRVNHEVLYHLKMSSAERASIQQRWGDVLNEKKRSTITIDYPSYMQAVYEILNAPVHSFDLTTRIGMAPLAFALSAVSGRRRIELMVTGDFKVKSSRKIEFFGQAKKRTGEDNGRIIYTLCDAKLFVEKLAILRGCPAASDFHNIMENKPIEETRSEHGLIDAILAKAWNPWVKTFFGDDRRVFKDSRAIYARIAYETWFKHDPRWKNLDEDVFFSEILGHDDENSQLHYKQFKLHNFSTMWKPNIGNKNTRLEALQALDDDMPGFARGDSAIRLHEWVKAQIESDPNATITTYTLRKVYGANPTMAARYLAYVSDALGVVVGDNGQYQRIDNSPKIILEVDYSYDDEIIDDARENGNDDNSLDDDEIEIEEELENDIEPSEEQEKPHFHPAVRKDGLWYIMYDFSGKTFTWRGEATNAMAAMKAAWEATQG